MKICTEKPEGRNIYMLEEEVKIFNLWHPNTLTDMTKWVLGVGGREFFIFPRNRISSTHLVISVKVLG